MQYGFSVTLYNVQFNSYTLKIKSEQYFSYQSEIVVNDATKPLQVRTQLIPKLAHSNQFVALLSWDNPDVQLGLFSTFKQSSKVECTSGMLSGTCDTMRFQHKQTVQSILFDGLQPKDYLIYVQYYPQTQAVQDLNVQV